MSVDGSGEGERPPRSRSPAARLLGAGARGAERGVGLVTDVGQRLTTITEALDDAAEKLIHRLLNRPGHEAETNQAGLVTRAVAAAIDIGLISLALSIGSGLLASVIPAATAR